MPVLEVRNVTKTFLKNKSKIAAVNNVSLQIHAGECVGLVGESGCGKSTLAKLITRLTDADTGEIYLNGQEITHCRGKQKREVYRDLQMVFQMPTDSFNPRLRLGSSIAEAMVNYGKPKRQAKQRTPELLDLVELRQEYADRYPHQLSGGECQRAAIARALAVDPKILICDEATSALDVSVQAQIVALLLELQKNLGMSYLFICHDLALVRNICNRILVMHRGSIVESGSTKEVLANPLHPYTRLLLSSVFPIKAGKDWKIPTLKQQVEPEGEGCKFWERCPLCMQRCREQKPELFAVCNPQNPQAAKHEAACFAYF